MPQASSGDGAKGQVKKDKLNVDWEENKRDRIRAFVDAGKVPIYEIAEEIKVRPRLPLRLCACACVVQL